MRVKEIFYSLQGEGFYTGKAAIFVRFAGCNLQCSFCDTDFKNGEGMTELEILSKIQELSDDCKFVVLTGGEPTLQVTENFIRLLHNNGYYIAMETNGTRKIPEGIDWVTVSPKKHFTLNAEPVVDICNEVKVIFDAQSTPDDCGIEANFYYLQPCDTQNEEKNKEIINKCVEYIKNNPKWQLSLQTQKILNVR